MGQNYPSLFLLFTLLSGKHPLQNHQGPLLRPSWDQGLLTTTTPINLSHLHENVQKMSFYIINYILQVIKILQPCPQ